MTSVLSVYWSPHHMRVREDDPNSDFAYIQALQPAWIRIHQPTATAIYHAQRAAPNARIMLRSWDIDDSNGERKRELYADPKGAAHKHLQLWRTKWDELLTEMHRNGWTANESRWYIGLVNEPDPAYTPQVVEYSLEAMRKVRGTSIRLGLVCSSVGTFSKPSENDHGWTRFVPLEQPINDGGHILIVHEYWQPEGPTFGEDAGNLAWRHQHIPLNVPILIGESGANGYIYGRHSQHDDAGWRKFMQPEQFAAQVKQYIEGCDSRVQGVCLYMTDYHSDQWQSFDTQPAMHQLLAIKDTKPAKRHTVHLPVIGNGPTPAEPEAHIPEQPDNTWQRSWPIVLKFEGGLSLDPNDTGNWYNGQLIGTKYGISAAVWAGQYDIPNLTQAQALSIYKTAYWDAANCDALPWPLCLAVFDHAINAGVGSARQLLSQSGPNFLVFMADRIAWYTRLAQFDIYGVAWMRRCAEVLREGAK